MRANATHRVFTRWAVPESPEGVEECLASDQRPAEGLDLFCDVPPPAGRLASFSGAQLVPATTLAHATVQDDFNTLAAVQVLEICEAGRRGRVHDEQESTHDPLTAGVRAGQLR